MGRERPRARADIASASARFDVRSRGASARREGRVGREGPPVSEAGRTRGERGGDDARGRDGGKGEGAKARRRTREKRLGLLGEPAPAPAGTRRGSELHLGYRPVAPARVPEELAVPSEKRSATVPIPGTMSRPRG